MIDCTRRHVLRTASLVTIGSLAGCQGDFPAGRILDVDRVSAELENGKWRVTVKIENINSAKDPSANFHGVTLLGYSEDRTQVCEKQIGTVSYRNDTNNGINVTLHCKKRPTVLTFEAEESPCNDTVSLGIAVYSNRTEMWYLNRFTRNCDEGLPPEPRGELQNNSS